MSNRVVDINGLRIGEGQPKICIPVVAENIEEIKKQSARIMYTPADMVEWRVDFLRRSDDPASVKVALDKLKEQLSEKPVLFTFRTGAEGGQKDISPKDYAALCRTAIDTGNIELIDLEFMLGRDIIEPLIKRAHEKGVKVILSNHDFHKTPPAEEMADRLLKMKEMGGDIAKIAVMPQCEKDVLALLQATDTARHADNPIPLITISMGPLGLVTRMSGELFGSSVTFASAGKGSAPGQIDADDLDRTLITLHDSLNPVSPSENRKRSGNNIILIGFMGVGKTTVSQKIAEKSDYQVVEMDELIEKRAGMSISAIFETQGEKAFRDMETALAGELSDLSGRVISCGGGTVMRPENVQALKKAGRIILLSARPETVLERVRKNAEKRPLLARYMSRGYISWLMKKRRDIYAAAADHIINVDGRGADGVAEEILSYMKSFG